jgi:hypothetical protein
MNWLGRSLRLLCAIAIAMTATFHVCDVTAARAVELISAAADDAAIGKGKSADVVAVEKCHTCAVVSLPAIAAPVAFVSPVHWIPQGTVLHLTPFLEPTVGPPPRA